jgi:hypothetical protein
VRYCTLLPFALDRIDVLRETRSATSSCPPSAPICSGRRCSRRSLRLPPAATRRGPGRCPAHFPPSKYLRVTIGGGTLTHGGRRAPMGEPRVHYEVALDAGSLTWSP